MTKITVPLPNSPFLIAGQRQGTFVVSREWQRFFTLIQQAIPDTDIIIDVDILQPPASPDGGVQGVNPFDLSGADTGEIDGLYAALGRLPPQPGTAEFGELVKAVANAIQFPAPPVERQVFTPDVPFPMPPTELGHLEAAKNAGYRIVASGNAVLVAGTVTVANTNANSANEFALTAKVVGGTQGILSVGTIVANTSFDINSSNAADTSTVSWVIFAPLKG